MENIYSYYGSGYSGGNFHYNPYRIEQKKAPVVELPKPAAVIVPQPVSREHMTDPSPNTLELEIEDLLILFIVLLISTIVLGIYTVTTLHGITADIKKLLDRV
jgi:hypothetical protein